MGECGGDGVVGGWWGWVAGGGGWRVEGGWGIAPGPAPGPARPTGPPIALRRRHFPSTHALGPGQCSPACGLGLVELSWSRPGTGSSIWTPRPPGLRLCFSVSSSLCSPASLSLQSGESLFPVEAHPCLGRFSVCPGPVDRNVPSPSPLLQPRSPGWAAPSGPPLPVCWVPGCHPWTACSRLYLSLHPTHWYPNPGQSGPLCRSLPLAAPLLGVSS